VIINIIGQASVMRWVLDYKYVS